MCFSYTLIIDFSLEKVKKFYKKVFASCFSKIRKELYMSTQHKKWNELVKQKMAERNWNNADLAQSIGFKRTSSVITELFNLGKGSDDLKLKISRKLGISESWEKFEE